MVTFIGDYPCKLDSKGRVLLPAAFRKLLNGDSESRCVLRKNLYEKCLDLYSITEWERQTELVRSKANPFNRKHAGFLREFFRGTAEVPIDASGRILIPKKFFEFAAFSKDIVMAGQDGKVEIWDANTYEKSALGEEKFGDLADEILGSGSNDE